jgi:hypothetical protein
MSLQPSRSSEPRPHRTSESWSLDPGRLALAAVTAAWAAGLALVLSHRVYVTNDSLSNYIHVWYVADRFWHGHGIPLHMPLLGHGEAYAFPYGFVPWFSAALLRPLFGDWIVTLWLVLGLLGVAATQWWAFPELRGAWWTALLLANPMLVEGVLLGQLPFLWSVAMLFAAVACWRRDRWLAAGLLLGLAQATHPAVILPIAGPLILGRLIWEPKRARLLSGYALSVLIAAAAAWLVVVSPSVGDSSTGTLAANFFETVSLRAIVVAAPFIGLVLQRTPLARIPAVILVGFVALNIILVPIRKNEFAWTALTRSADESLLPFIRSEDFHPGATYRILRVADGKVGMYQLLRGGARLDSEPFPESIDRRSWPAAADYVAFLKRRRVDYVIIYRAYDERYRTNEHDLLQQLSATASSSGSPCASLVVSPGEYEVFAVTPGACLHGEASAP